MLIVRIRMARFFMLSMNNSVAGESVLPFSL